MDPGPRMESWESTTVSMESVFVSRVDRFERDLEFGSEYTVRDPSSDPRSDTRRFERWKNQKLLLENLRKANEPVSGPLTRELV